MRIYIASAYLSGGREEVERNVELAIKVWHLLKDMGHDPFCPHLYYFLDKVHPRPYIEWLNYDLVYLRMCDMVYRVPNKSSGADKEVEAALAVGIPVAHSIWEVPCGVDVKVVRERALELGLLPDPK